MPAAAADDLDPERKTSHSGSLEPRGVFCGHEVTALGFAPWPSYAPTQEQVAELCECNRHVAVSFDSERVLENVQDAVKSQGIGWPVVQDNDYAIWKAYGNHYWPHFYLVDERGQIIYDHIGEGAYDQTDAQIAAALAAAKGQ